MKTILISVTALCIYFISNTASAQSSSDKTDQLSGNMDLIIDVSEMKDTAGRFMLMVGGEIIYPSVKNNKLVVSKLLEEPRRAFLAFYTNQALKANPGKALNEIPAGYFDFLYFLSTPGNLTIHVKGNVANSEFGNVSEGQRKYKDLLMLKDNVEKKFSIENQALISQLNSSKDKAEKDSLIAVYRKSYKDHYLQYYRDSILGFVRDNPDSPASLIELEEYAHINDKDLKLFTSLYNNLTDRMKILPTAKRIYNTVEAENFAVNSLLGKSAPAFTQNDKDGKAVSLSDFKGHVTLLEFWASWCGPCREANPALVKIYQKFKGKGFKILGVSLDNNEKNWLKAIKDDKLDWDQVSDLKFWKNSAAELYHVVGIPTNFLIDENGKVLAKDLNDKQLEEQLSKLLQ